MMHILGKVLWVVTALASLNIGTSALFNMDMLSMLPLELAKPVAVLVGIAGLLSLVFCVRCCAEKCNDNNQSPHNHTR